ncbi:MAG: hypothetical protein ACRC6X_04470 [Culicoidibacterales bacterium]
MKKTIITGETVLKAIAALCLGIVVSLIATYLMGDSQLTSERTFSLVTGLVVSILGITSHLQFKKKQK